MKKMVFTALTAVLGLTGMSQAAVLQAKLEAVNQGAYYDVSLYVHTDTPLGVSGMQFDVLTSDSVGQAAPVPAALTGPNASKVKTTFNTALALGSMTTVTPLKQDGDADTDLDAMGGSFFDANNFILDTVGVGGWYLIATEQWKLSGSYADLSLNIIGAQYFDYDNGTAPNYRLNYDSVQTTGTRLGSIPEPASLALVAVGGLALLRRRMV